ncbi:hypothetical protein QMO56_13575 [Roseomonas sp. E05]|uniref:hypothetical protein n=1 Tax=Roseomonas sp. E05 TaxID=3046310 RepID=UPI0024BB23D0|nr:hypothetical protein [Roseomonas sp. E05]MDJ0389147.1 hypothetical protein [Roseomonas sp. E05]
MKLSARNGRPGKVPEKSVTSPLSASNGQRGGDHDLQRGDELGLKPGTTANLQGHRACACRIPLMASWSIFRSLRPMENAPAVCFDEHLHPFR